MPAGTPAFPRKRFLRGFTHLRGNVLSCRIEGVAPGRIYAQECIIFHDSASALTSQWQVLRNPFTSTQPTTCSVSITNPLPFVCYLSPCLMLTPSSLTCPRRYAAAATHSQPGPRTTVSARVDTAAQSLSRRGGELPIERSGGGVVPASSLLSRTADAASPRSEV